MFGQATAKDPQPGSLAYLANQFRAIARRASSAVEQVGIERVARKPSPARWSVAENLIHLTLTSEACLPVWRESLHQARAEAKMGVEPYHLDTWGKFWLWFLEPPAKLRIRTASRFRPVNLPPNDQVLSTFLASQGTLVSALQLGEGLALDKIQIRAVFNQRIRYSLWSSFHATLGHQRRHLEQAESVVERLSQAQLFRRRIME